MGDGVSLNANTANKYVAAGQITAGDFVEYYSEPTYISQPSGNPIFCFNIGAYVVGLRGVEIVLYKGNEEVSSYSDYSVSQICQYGDFIIFKTSDTVGVLKIQNDQLVLVDTGSASGTCISAGNGKVVLLTIKNSSAYYYIKNGYVFDISNTGELSNGKSLTYASEYPVGNYSRVQSIGLVYVDSTEAFYTYTKCTTEENPYNYKVEVDAENNLTLTSTYMGGLSSAWDCLGQFDRRLIIGKSASLASHDVISGAFSSFNIDNFYYPGIIDNNLFVTYGAVSSAIKIRLYYYNDQTNNITLLDEYTTTYEAISLNFTAYNHETGYVYVPYNSNNAYRLRLLTVINNNAIQDIPDQDKVKAYMTGGHPIGVAKTDGNIGDTIPIYVPTPSV